MFKKARFYRKMKKKYSMNRIEFKNFKNECEKELRFDPKMMAENDEYDLECCFVFKYTSLGHAYWYNIFKRCKK